MTYSDRQWLFRIVRRELEEGCTRKRLEEEIFAAHNGKPDGFLVTNDNLWLFRQYRNSVSGNPARLVDEALRFQEEEAVR
jgi:hypothetical protein